MSTTERDDRCHDREIDADISIRTLILNIPWQKRKSRRDVGPPVSSASVREPTDKGKNQHHDNEDFEKGIHHAICDRLGPPDHPNAQQRPFVIMP